MKHLAAKILDRFLGGANLHSMYVFQEKNVIIR